MTLPEFLEQYYSAVEASITQTISELIDTRDALDNAGLRDSKYDALQKVIDSEEKLRRHFIDSHGAALTPFEMSQLYGILQHRMEIFQKKRADLDKAIDGYQVLIDSYSEIVNKMTGKSET